MSAVIEVVQFKAPLASGNQTITQPKLGGLTPKAVIFFWGGGVVNGIPKDSARIGVGAATGPLNRWAVTCRSRNGQIASSCVRRASGIHCIQMINNSATTIDGQADFVTFVVNGCTVNWPTVPNTEFKLEAVFFAGTDLSAHADTIALSTQDTTVDVADPGFQPQGLVLASAGGDFNNTTLTNAIFNFGVASFDGSTISQVSYGWDELDASGTTVPEISVENNRCIDDILGGYQVEASDFDSSGFSLIARSATSGGDLVGYLALSFNNVIQVKAGVEFGPGSSGLPKDVSYTGPGFKPQAIICGVTWHDAFFGTTEDTVDAGTFGISAITPDDQVCESMQVEDGIILDPAVTNTQSHVNIKALHLSNHDGLAGNEASHVRMDAIGYTWNYTAVHINGEDTQHIYLAFEEEAITGMESSWVGM